MAARDYSQFKNRKQTAPGKGSVPKHKEIGMGKDAGVTFKTADWGLSGANKSNPGWGSDTAKVDTYVKCEGVAKDY